MSSTRKRGANILRCAPLLFAALLGGCIHVEETLKIEKDGSGVIDITYGMSEENADRMQELAQTMIANAEGGASTASMPFGSSEEQIRNDFKEYEASGVALKSISTEDRDGWKYRRLVIGFPSLAALAETGFLSDRNLSVSRDEGGNYVFCQLSDPKAQPAGLNGNGDPQTEAAMKEIMKGFRAVVRIETPGRILETTATDKTDRSATWTFDFDEDPKALERIQA
ncbi:MAG: hypothetical protein BWK77_03760, partial [Verrucomicrobia bacterium A1]